MKKWLAIFLLVFTGSAFAAGGEVRVFNWTEYMPDEVLAGFKKETGITVKYTTFESNESMYAKVKLLQGKGYDVVFPSTYFVNRMRREDLLRPMDHNKLSGFTNLDATLLNKPFDPENKFSVPYLWGTSGICVNKKFIDSKTVSKWTDLWNPDYKGRVMLIDDMRDVLGIGLKVLGFSFNDTDPTHIEAAYNKMKELMPSVRVFAADSVKMPFLNEEVHIGSMWSGDLFMAQADNPDLTYIYPEEGAFIWMDSMVIPKNAENVENAYKFIDYILRPKVAKTISESIGYASPNKAAIDLMDKETRENPIIYPPQEILNKAEFQTDVGEAILVYEKFWEKLKSN
jgi:spermidine/putrescine transport system substrate-binding protein